MFLPILLILVFRMHIELFFFIENDEIIDLNRALHSFARMSLDLIYVNVMLQKNRTCNFLLEIRYDII